MEWNDDRIRYNPGYLNKYNLSMSFQQVPEEQSYEVDEVQPRSFRMSAANAFQGSQSIS